MACYRKHSHFFSPEDSTLDSGILEIIYIVGGKRHPKKLNFVQQDKFKYEFDIIFKTLRDYCGLDISIGIEFHSLDVVICEFDLSNNEDGDIGTAYIIMHH